MDIVSLDARYIVKIIDPVCICSKIICKIEFIPEARQIEILECGFRWKQ